MEYSVDKDIPIPDESRKNGLIKYPFKTMEIGDSFLIRCTENKYRQIQDKMARAAQSLRNRNKTAKMYFISRYAQKERGLRVWRIK